MEKILFTKEEKKEIEKSLGLVLDDIRELWKLAQSDKIEISIDKGIFNNYGDYTLSITKERVRLEYFDWELNTKYIHFERTGIKKTNRIPSDYQFALIFVAEYEKIRKKLEQTLKAGIDDKELYFQKLKEINMKYDKYADIEIEAPPSNNLQELPVTEENGKKILTLDFGERTIRLITNGEIVLVNKTKTYQSKVKSK